MIRGVNLGGWLVLEKWICEDVFEGTDAQDESELFACLTFQEYKNRLEKHFNTFIQEQDIKKISDYGLNLVRLPIPFTLFGDKERNSCVEYVDRLFDWALKYNIQVILDLHTVPGGQNGLDNSGFYGLCTWHKERNRVEEVIEILERVASRYCLRPNLYGIELLNEPISKERFESLKKRIDDRYKERIEVSDFIPTLFLKDFYTECYVRLDKILKNNQKIIIHDGFRLNEWHTYFPQEDFPKLVIDTHMYLNFISRELKENTSQYYIDFIFSRFFKELKEASKYHPVIVGEWTLAHHHDDENEMSLDGYKNYMKAICNLQKMVFEISNGWIYFNYKVNDKKRLNWDLSHVIEKGFFQ